MNAAYMKIYMKRYRAKYPERISRYNKSWRDKQTKTKQLMSTQKVNNRSDLLSYLKPTCVEYAEFSPKTQQVIKLTGCKYMTNGHFCNAVCLKGKPYCQDHYIICYQQIEK